MAKSQKPKRSLPVRIVRGLLLLIVLGAAVVLALRLWGYYQGAETYRELQMQMQPSVSQTSQENSDDAAAGSEEENSKETPLLNIDFESMWKQNEEVVAWLEFPALGISYPVMHTDNNRYYLNHLWNGKENQSGSLFLDANNGSINDLYTIVYGHNMHDGSMFGLFNRYLDEDFCKENGASFRLYTPEGTWQYDVFTVAEVPNDDKIYTTGYLKGELYDSFLKDLASYTLYDTGTEAQSGDTVMTLSTCTASDSIRRVLCARRAKQLQ